jgi:beta-lactam-binding protein with PASTA domain
LTPFRLADTKVFDSSDGGKVVYQYPAAGTWAPVGSNVQFSIGLWSGVNR